MNPEKKADFSTEWPKVTAGFNQILSAIETGNGINHKEWMFHYNSVFQLAIAQHEEKMYVEIARIFENFVRGQSKKIFEKGTGELMLKEYLKLFGDFTKTSLSVSRICRYLQHYWIPGNLGKQPSSVEVREIYPLALVMWRQHCFEPIKDKLIPSLLDLLDQDRQGNKQDKSLIRNMVQSYIEFDKVGPNEGQQFYEKEFESRYIERLKQSTLQNQPSFWPKMVSPSICKRLRTELQKKRQMPNTSALISQPANQRLRKQLMRFLLKNIWRQFKRTF